MKRQQRTIGSILEIDLQDDTFAYTQVLDKANFAFFDYKAKQRLSNFNILTEVGILFIAAVYKDVVTEGRWLKVDKMAIQGGLEILPMKFIQDALEPSKFSSYNPNTGEMIPCTREQANGLECAAVWEAEHIESRIRDHYEGKSKGWAEQLEIE